jgi:CubicO group peptidase (beta-lactamase class C family)
MSRKRIPIWLVLIVLAPGLLLAFILGLWAFVTATATTFHPDPQDVPSVRESAPPPQWADAVERGRRIMVAGLTEQNLPGLSVAVGVGGEIVWAEGFGWADLETRVPVEPATRFQIGMASKVLTSAAVGMLLEQDRLKLDDEIRTYVPTFPQKEWPVTLRQLMGHLAGVRTDGGDEGLPGFHCDRAVEGLRLFAERSLLFEPGTRYRYSNYGWILVSAAVETAADEPFFRFMRTRIFEPLGMNDTTADSATDPAPDRAAFYFPRFAADPRYGHDGMRQVDYSCFAGSGGFASTPSDLVRFGMAIDSGEVLQPATVELLQTSQRPPSDEETGYGLGWDLETVTLAGEETLALGHDGEVMGGRVVSFLTFPEHGIVVAVTSNIAWSDTFSLAVEVAGAFVVGRRGRNQPRRF